MLNISTEASKCLWLYYNPRNMGSICDDANIISVRISCEAVSRSTKF